MSESGAKNPTFGYSFAGKHVLITGAGQGIGRALFTTLYHDGAQVFTLEKEGSLVDDLRQKFPNARIEQADITKWTNVQSLIEDFGVMDHLVNNAGTVVLQPFLEATEDAFDKQFNLNMKAVFSVSQAVTKGMIANGKSGTIVNIASTAGHLSCGMPVYSASKAGVQMLSKCMAHELGKYNIRTNCLSITAADTPLFRKSEPFLPKDVNIFRQPLAGKRVLDLDEVVNSILYLLSPLSSMTNGHNLIVDGGISIC